ncbi:MAG: AgmX/PglI C-terminal domain-containing protein [Deltaproteobacteria bacterium]|nr:AgmX/PglI C-terminal domain-containing protein [Nannocystaceae bacterium]
MATRSPTYRAPGCGRWLLPLFLLACHRQATAPTGQPSTKPTTQPVAVVTIEAPEQPEMREIEALATTEDPEFKGVRRIIRPGDEGSGLYEQPMAVASALRSKDEIKQVIRAHLREIRACYERGLMRKPDLAGTVRLTFAIAEGGAVESTQTEIGFPDEQVADCIAGIAKTFVFPPAPGHGKVVVTYPFVLQTDAS